MAEQKQAENVPLFLKSAKNKYEAELRETAKKNCHPRQRYLGG
jgi:hypothetical protein